MSQPITSGTISITHPDIRNQTPVGGPNYAYYSSGVTYYDYDDGNLPTGAYTAAGAYTPATGIKGILYLGYRNITRPLNSSYNSWYGDYKITQLAIWRKLGLRTANSGYGSGVWDSAGSLMTTGSNLSQTAYPVSTVGVYKFTRTDALMLIGTSNVVKLTVAANGGTATTYAGLSYVYLPQSVSTTLPPAISRNNSSNQNSYTVAYQANGGSSTPSTQTSTKYYSYTFSKWQVNSTNYNASGSITLSDAATATAQWTSTTHQNAVTLAAKINRNNGTSTRTVSFNVNGGSGTVNSLNSTATVTYTFSKWQRTSDNATYNAGASFTPSANTTMKATWTSSTGNFSAITLPAAPTAPTGKHFTGWYTASSGGTKAGNAGASYTPDQTRTLYAQWAYNTYTISYNGNGNTGGTVPASQTKTYGTALTLRSAALTKSDTNGYTVSFNINGSSGTTPSNIIQKVGYTDNGWNTNSSGTGTHYADGGSYTTNAAATLYCQWTVTRKSITLPAAPTAPTGKHFTGWYTASSGGTKAGNASASWTPDTTRTLYAQWAWNTYTVSYNGNGNTGGTVPANQTKTYGTALTLSSNVLTHSDTSGYVVSFNVNGGSGTVSNVTQKIGWTDDGWATSASGAKAYNKGGSYTTNAAATMYAHWVTTRKAITLPAAPTAPTGKHFTGWYTASSGGTKRGNAGGTYTPTASETLYAQWAYDTYTITFNANGGTLGTPTTQTKTYGTDLTLRAGCTHSNSSASNSYTVSYNANGGSSTPSTQTNTKYTAYSFSKWNTKSDGTGTNYNAGGTYSANAAATMYAQWSTSTVQNAITLASAIDRANSSTSYTVIFNANGGSVSPSSATSTATITYAFEKWHLNSASGTGYSAGASYTPNANCTMHAGWTPTTGTYSAVSLPTPTRTGFTCSGWYTASSGGTKRGDAGGSYTPTASETLYPHWTANTYTMSYALGGGTQSHGSNYQYQSGDYTYIMNPTNVAYDMSNFTDTLNSSSGINPNFMIQQATKTGYINDYWTITNMGTNTHYFYYDDGNGRTAQPSTATSIVTNWLTASATDQHRPLCRYLRATSGTVTATAHWTPITYTVVFKSGNTELGTQSFTYDTAQNLTTYADLTAPSTPSTTYGWSFYGWATNYNTTTRNYVDGASANNLTSTDGATVTLYAIYKRNITFKYYNSASATSVTTDTSNIQYYINSSATAAGGTSVTVPALYTNSTYGWAPYGWIRNANTYTAASGFPTDGSSTSVTPSVTLSPLLYALYTRTVTLNYNANGGSGTTTATTGAQRRNANNTNAETITLITATSTFTPPAGYAFDKWNTANDASGTDYAEGANYSWSNIAWTSAKTNTLYAIYKPHALVHFYQDSNNQWKPAFVYVWNSTNSEWELTMPYGYTSNGWKVGGP